MTKYRKRRRSAAPVVITVVILLLAALAAAWFGYGYYMRKTYPIVYENYVERYAARNGLDKYLVYAVIKTESGFRPEAESNVGARGLMQIMEDTFEWIKYRTDDDSTEYDDMYDPETNIKYGCYLVGYLYDEFGSVETAMAAYHAGRGAVNGWLGDKRYSSDGRTLDSIPISDTAHYVDKITSAMETYITLYKE